jgi:syntaxin 5
MPTQSLQQLSLMTSAPDTSYLESRGAALQGIESTINELGTIYRQLATMIAEQGEVVQRIDMNVEDMHMNIERGQGELLKYLRNVSSNRWLMIKIFAILIIFVIFFSTFLL